MPPDPARSTRYVTDSAPETARSSQEPRFRIYRLCECDACEDASGKDADGTRCVVCRGEGRIRERVAECETEEAIGVALITLGREGEFEGCAVGILDRDGEVNQRWILKPWLPSPRNVSDAGRVLAKSKQGKGNT